MTNVCSEQTAQQELAVACSCTRRTYLMPQQHLPEVCHGEEGIPVDLGGQPVSRKVNEPLSFISCPTEEQRQHVHRLQRKLTSTSHLRLRCIWT